MDEKAGIIVLGHTKIPRITTREMIF